MPYLDQDLFDREREASNPVYALNSALIPAFEEMAKKIQAELAKMKDDLILPIWKRYVAIHRACWDEQARRDGFGPWDWESFEKHGVMGELKK